MLTGEFEVTNWNEDAYVQREGERKLTRATVEQNVSGDVSGRSTTDWLMTYQPDGTARFVGLQQLEGDIDGRSGTVVLESVGEYDGNEASGVLTIVPGSGTGAWSALRGTGSFRAPHGTTASYSLECSFE